MKDRQPAQHRGERGERDRKGNKWKKAVYSTGGCFTKLTENSIMLCADPFFNVRDQVF